MLSLEDNPADELEGRQEIRMKAIQKAPLAL
jgi:hypothetical protein